MYKYRCFSIQNQEAVERHRNICTQEVSSLYSLFVLLTFSGTKQRLLLIFIRRWNWEGKRHAPAQLKCTEETTFSECSPLCPLATLFTYSREHPTQVDTKIIATLGCGEAEQRAGSAQGAC